MSSMNFPNLAVSSWIIPPAIEILATIKAAHTTYGTLPHRVFNNHGLTIKPKSWSSEPGSSPPVCTLARHELCIVGTSNVWSGSSKRSSEESFPSVGRRASPTTMSSHGQLSPASKLPSFNIASTGWVTCPEYSGITQFGKRLRKYQKRRFKDKLKSSLTQAKIDP